jgi:hypothetical protein
MFLFSSVVVCFSKKNHQRNIATTQNVYRQDPESSFVFSCVATYLFHVHSIQIDEHQKFVTNKTRGSSFVFSCITTYIFRNSSPKQMKIVRKYEFGFCLWFVCFLVYLFVYKFCDYLFTVLIISTRTLHTIQEVYHGSHQTVNSTEKDLLEAII